MNLQQMKEKHIKRQELSIRFMSVDTETGLQDFKQITITKDMLVSGSIKVIKLEMEKALGEIITAPVIRHWIENI